MALCAPVSSEEARNFIFGAQIGEKLLKGYNLKFSIFFK
jgi:hypothetical protein